MNEFYGKTLGQAIFKSNKDKKLIKHGNTTVFNKKGRFGVLAPPLFWEPWVQIWAQFGVIGPNKDKHQARINVSFLIPIRCTIDF